jgi:hypothetical protein
LCDRKGAAIILRVGNAETRGNALLDDRELIIGAIQGLKRYHGTDIGVH